MELQWRRDISSTPTPARSLPMSKVEKLAVACKYLEWKNKKTEMESNIISMLSYCLAVWGLIYSWRKKVQKAMNQAIRMLLNCNITKENLLYPDSGSSLQDHYFPDQSLVHQNRWFENRMVAPELPWRERLHQPGSQSLQ